MESMNKEQIEEIWITVSNYLPERMKVDCAVDYVKTLVDMDVDPEVIKSSVNLMKITTGHRSSSSRR